MYKQGMGNAKNISLDDVCHLVSTKIITDDNFQKIPVPFEEEMFCSVLSINQFEFKNAQAAGNRPSRTFVFNYDDYNNEQKILYEGKMYTVYRTFVRSDGYIECHCEEKMGK